jgi:hypothetical protein
MDILILQILFTVFFVIMVAAACLLAWLLLCWAADGITRRRHNRRFDKLTRVVIAVEVGREGR